MDKDGAIHRALETCLKVIGWSMAHRGCEFYNLINEHGESTSFMYRNGTLEISDHGKSKIYGGKGQGAVVFNLNRCHVRVADDRQAVFITEKQNKGVFLSFYNFSK